MKIITNKSITEINENISIMVNKSNRSFESLMIFKNKPYNSEMWFGHESIVSSTTYCMTQHHMLKGILLSLKEESLIKIAYANDLDLDLVTNVMNYAKTSFENCLKMSILTDIEILKSRQLSNVYKIKVQDIKDAEDLYISYFGNLPN